MTRKKWLIASVVVVACAAAASAGAVVMYGGSEATQTREPPPNTAKVTRGKLSAMVSVDGTLTYRARSDGSAYSIINQSGGTYTDLPREGDKVDCGDVLYRVDNKPVLLLCGTLPAYRDLWFGDAGNDVAQLNRNLHTLGYDSKAGVALDTDNNAFTDKTVRAFQLFQHDKGLPVTGVLAIGDAVFLPESVLIAKVTAELGGAAQPGAAVASATSDTPEVQVNLEPSQQSEVKKGDQAQITLPDNSLVTGTVNRLGRVARVPDTQNSKDAAATIPAYISLDDPAPERGLDQAPVQVAITTDGVDDALSVPVTALVGKSGGGFAVDVVRDDGRRELVTVKLGLFDTTAGRVQVDGQLGEDDQVVVPSP